MRFLACCTTQDWTGFLHGAQDPDPTDVVFSRGQDVDLRAVEQVGGEEVQRQHRPGLGPQEFGDDGRLSRWQVSTDRSRGLGALALDRAPAGGEVRADGWWEVVP